MGKTPRTNPLPNCTTAIPYRLRVYLSLFATDLVDSQDSNTLLLSGASVFKPVLNIHSKAVRSSRFPFDFDYSHAIQQSFMVQLLTGFQQEKRLPVCLPVPACPPAHPPTGSNKLEPSSTWSDEHTNPPWIGSTRHMDPWTLQVRLYSPLGALSNKKVCCLPILTSVQSPIPFGGKKFEYSN